MRFFWRTSAIVLMIGTMLLAFSGNTRPSAETSDELGDCSFERWMEYFEIAAEAAPMIYGGPYLDEFADGAYERFRAEFARFPPEKDVTTFISTDLETGDIYTASCAEYRCSGAEASDAEIACLRNIGADCVTIALVYMNDTYCLAYPRD